MLRHYLRTALRGFRREKFYTGLNIAGLAVGLACCLLILLYVQDETSYDQFYADADRIVRIAEDYATETGVSRLATTPVPIAPILGESRTDIDHVTRVLLSESLVSSRPDRQFTESGFAYADSAFFEVFPLAFKAGDAETALDAPMSVVLTASMAERYFGDTVPIGETLSIRNEEGAFDFDVTGVIEDIPANSHLAVDVLASMVSLESMDPQYENWWYPRVYTYARLAAGANPATLEAELPDLIAGVPTDYRYSDAPPAFTVQSVPDIHLHSQREAEMAPNSNAAYVTLFTLIAFGVLAIACVNFMNLATARAVRRSREVGMRKAIGAGRRQLVVQFLAESVAIAALAALLAIGLVALALPSFNAVAGKSLVLALGAAELGVLVALVMGTGLIAGSYPALILSGFQPVRSLRGTVAAGRPMDVLLRKGLTTIQFALSMALIVGSLAVYRQLDLLREDRLGFDKEHVVTVQLRDRDDQVNHEALETVWSGLPGVQAVSASSGVPGMEEGTHTFEVFPDAAAQDSLRMQVLFVGYDYAEALGLELVAGRDFDRDYPGDVTGAFVLNEAAAQTMGWENPVGERLSLRYHLGEDVIKAGEVVGVIRDFQYHALREAPVPTLLHLLPGTYYNDVMSARLAPGNPQPALAAMEAAWAEFNPDRPFEFAFLDDQFDALYRAEARLGVLTLWFTILAIGIACLGLLGLAAHAAERRRKEVGVRKVLGASIPGLVRLLVGEFMRPVGLAAVLAVPLAYLVLDRWLDGFAERIVLGPDLFALAIGLGGLVAVVTVSIHALRSAMYDPIRALRD
ncbi:MAG: ABC transporter permease [Rubricoccaceae bacterium]